MSSAGWAGAVGVNPDENLGWLSRRRRSSCSPTSITAGRSGRSWRRMAASPALATNLPAQLSSFIGRRAELVAVRRLVAGSRLVTLTGAGGVGKTPLGLQGGG